MRALDAIEICGDAGQLRTGACTSAGVSNDLVAVAEVVDQLCLDRLLGEKGPAVDCLAGLGLRQFAAFRDPSDNLPADRRQERLDFFTMRRGHLGFGQQVHRGLVLLAMLEFGHDPEEVERSLDEEGLGVKAGQPDIAGGLQPDLIECRRHVVGPGPRAELAEAVGKSQRELALAAKRGNRIADFLNLGETEFVVTEASKQNLDPGVFACRFDRIEDVAQCRPVTGDEPQQGVFAGAFCQILRQIHAQHDVARKRRDRRFEPGDNRQYAGDEEHRKNPNRGEKADDQAPHAGSDDRGIRGSDISAERAMAQQVVGEHRRHHRLADRDGADADARIVPALGLDLDLVAVGIDGAHRRAGSSWSA